MSPFTVDWLLDAENDLADIWTRAPAKPAVSAAANVIDQLLETDPLGNGTAVAEGLYKPSVPPLLVYYEVNEAERRVEVSNVVYYPS